MIGIAEICECLIGNGPCAWLIVIVFAKFFFPSNWCYDETYGVFCDEAYGEVSGLVEVCICDINAVWKLLKHESSLISCSLVVLNSV